MKFVFYSIFCEYKKVIAILNTSHYNILSNLKGRDYVLYRYSLNIAYCIPQHNGSSFVLYATSQIFKKCLKISSFYLNFIGILFFCVF